MRKPKRLTVGVMIHYLDNDYSKVLLKGITAAAEELDVNLVIMPGRSLNCQLHDLKNTAYEFQYNTIYSYACAHNLDALIVSAGTVGQFITRQEFKAFLDGFEGLPIITLESDVEGYPCIRLSGSGIKEIVNHLIKEHNRKYVAFVSGPKGNTDAEERLSYYREALEENGIEYNPNMVAYAKFSEYCVDIVDELLDRNEGKIDAICFANDMMCKGGYKAIEKRGLVIGRDISVTGYDDSEIATVISPQLSTVRADASVLGERAIREAVKLAEGKKADGTLNLSSVLVKRESCGCDSFWGKISESRNEYIINTSPAELAKLIIENHISRVISSDNAVVKELQSIIERFFIYAKDPLKKDHSDHKRIFDTILSDGLIKTLSPSTFMDVLRAVRSIAAALCGDNREKLLAVHSITEYGFDTVSDYLLFRNANNINDLNFTHFLISNIPKDMLLSANDEEDRFRSIISNLSRMHTKCAYIYAYEEPVVCNSYEEWKRPRYLCLKAYSDNGTVNSVPVEKQRIKSENCLNNRFMSDRRRTLILFPLFINQENYGVLVTEMEFEYHSYIYSIAPQICTAIKLMNLVEQLESSLDAATFRNNQLNRISTHDELTGIYNRRGFYEFANLSFTAPENKGRRCAIIFADMDNLKNINDNFGHEEGDYALKMTASFIKNGLRNTDVVARIGGDEFAAFTLFDDDEPVHSIPERIKSIAEKYNRESDKKYNITVSIGVYELNCSPQRNISMYMDKADSLLYEDKKNKSKDIFKK